MLALTSGRNRDATLERCGALHGHMQTLDSQLRIDRNECERAGDRAHQAEKSVKELREELHKLGEKKAQIDAQVQLLRNDITASTQLNQCVALGAFSTPVVFGLTSDDDEDDATLELQRRAKLAESIIKLADATCEKILERKDEKICKAIRNKLLNGEQSWLMTFVNESNQCKALCTTLLNSLQNNDKQNDTFDFRTFVKVQECLERVAASEESQRPTKLSTDTSSTSSHSAPQGHPSARQTVAELALNDLNKVESSTRPCRTNLISNRPREADSNASLSPLAKKHHAAPLFESDD